jgi:hypothetical protein
LSRGKRASDLIEFNSIPTKVSWRLPPDHTSLILGQFALPRHACGFLPFRVRSSKRAWRSLRSLRTNECPKISTRGVSMDEVAMHCKKGITNGKITYDQILLKTELNNCDSNKFCSRILVYKDLTWKERYTKLQSWVFRGITCKKVRCLHSTADLKRMNAKSLRVALWHPARKLYRNVTSVKLSAYSQSFVFKLHTSSTPITELISLSLIITGCLMIGIKFLFASKYFIYIIYFWMIEYSSRQAISRDKLVQFIWVQFSPRLLDLSHSMMVMVYYIH